MTYVVDTSVLIDHLRGDPRAQRLLTRALRSRRRRLTASPMTKVEILAGMRASEEETTRKLLGTIEWIPVDDPIAERAGLLARRHLRAHPGVDPVDYVIAATTEALGGQLWTRNVKHFPMFPELRAPYPP